MGSAPGAGRSIAIIEWRHEGHRFGYVAAVARSAIEAGATPVLFTDRRARSTTEFAAQLTGIDGLEVVDLDRSATTIVGFFRALQQARRSGAAGVVVPEVDTLLPYIVLAALLRWRWVPMTGIVMRPPRSDARLLRSLWYRAKATLIRSDRWCPGLELLLLEDPLADDGDLVWPADLVLEDRRLDDPADLYAGSRQSLLPDELAGMPRDRPVVTIMGVIDHRKQIPLALDAWKCRRLGDHATLVIAGKQREDLRPTITQACAEDGSIVTADRYLTNAEMSALIERSSTMLLLYDVGTSSGMLTTSAAVGRWTVVRSNTRVGRIALRKGFGIASAATPEAVSEAIVLALARSVQPQPLALPTSQHFGDRVLRSHLER